MKKPDTLVLVRHGQTEWNLSGRMQGQLDSPLTARGKEQARAAGRRLRRFYDGRQLPPLFTSPLGRAAHTASLLAAEAGLEEGAPEHDARIAEVSFGELEGLTEEEILERYPSEGAARRADKWHYVHPGGESYSGSVARVVSFLDEIARHPEVMVVAHVGISRVLRAQYLDLDLTEIAYLPHRQNQIFVLRDGGVEVLETDAPDDPAPFAG